MGEARTEILERLLRRQKSELDKSGIESALIELGQPPMASLDAPDPLEAFMIRLHAAHGSIEIAQDRSAAVHCISNYVYRVHNTRRIVAGHDARLAAMPWRDGGVLVRFDAVSAEDPVATSYARLAIAESGSLVLYSGRSNPSANNWLVQDHIVLLDAQDLVVSFEGAWARVRSDLVSGEIPRGVNFISGPSSTGDIVGHLVQGAHGPQRLHVVYIGDSPEHLLSYTQPSA